MFRIAPNMMTKVSSRNTILLRIALLLLLLLPLPLLLLEVLLEDEFVEELLVVSLLLAELLVHVNDDDCWMISFNVSKA